MNKRVIFGVIAAGIAFVAVGFAGFPCATDHRLTDD